MTTTFQVNDIVTPTANVQGLKVGLNYTVTGIAKQNTAFGTFVTYTLTMLLGTSGAQSFNVANGHLILKTVN